MAAILGLDYAPIPPSEITERLAQMDPHLTLMWGEGLGTPGWWLIWKWREDDPRREWIKRGEMDPASAFDWFCQLPQDCTVEQAGAWATATLRGSQHPEAKRLYGRTGEYNKARQSEMWKPIMDQAFEEIEHYGHKLFAGDYGTVPKVRRQLAPIKRGKTAKETA